MRIELESLASQVPDEDETISELRTFFERYGTTFVDLAIGKRSDLDALLEFYDAPLRFVSSTFHMVMKDRAAITGPNGMGGEIDRLRRAGFAGSTLDKCRIKMLNPRAALVDALWLRRGPAGALMARFIYLVALTAEGWRITALVSTS